MKLYILFGQREEDYPGQFGPEAIAVIDEYTDEGNTEWIMDKKKEMDSINEFISTEIVTIDISKDGVKEIRDRLNNNLPPISGQVIEDQ